jgi:hypothetical protein
MIPSTTVTDGVSGGCVDVSDKDDKTPGTPDPATDAHHARDDSAPSAPSAAADSLNRRSFLSRVGTSTAAFAAGLPGFSLNLPMLDWNTVAKLSAEAFRIAVNEWIVRARVQGGRVSGSAAILPAGSLVSDVSIDKRMVELLAASQVSPIVSTPIANVLAGAWYEWAGGFQMQIPGAYPALAAVPAPSAPPTKATVSPLLSQGSSAGEGSLKAPVLAARLVAALRMQALGVAAGSPDQAMQNLAAWVDGSFTQWKNTVRMTSLIGRGSVPTYAPPYVPVGPVIRGETSSAGSLFAGPRFGIIVQ